MLLMRPPLESMQGSSGSECLAFFRRVVFITFQTAHSGKAWEAVVSPQRWPLCKHHLPAHKVSRKQQLSLDISGRAHTHTHTHTQVTQGSKMFTPKAFFSGRLLSGITEVYAWRFST